MLAIFYKFIFFFIGGSSIGCARSAGNLPAFHLTYTPFKNNETHLMRYWPKVPKYYIDKDQEPENMQGKKCCISDILRRPQNFGPSSTFYLSNKERKISQIFRATHNIWSLKENLSKNFKDLQSVEILFVYFDLNQKLVTSSKTKIKYDFFFVNS